MILRPRNDGVVIRRVKIGQTDKGVHLPDASIEGVRHIVVTKGPKVEDLEIGDNVLLMGTKGQDYGFIPNTSDLIFTKEGNLALVYEQGEEE